MKLEHWRGCAHKSGFKQIFEETENNDFLGTEGVISFVCCATIAPPYNPNVQQHIRVLLFEACGSMLGNRSRENVTISHFS